MNSHPDDVEAAGAAFDVQKYNQTVHDGKFDPEAAAEIRPSSFI